MDRNTHTVQVTLTSHATSPEEAATFVQAAIKAFIRDQEKFARFFDTSGVSVKALLRKPAEPKPAPQKPRTLREWAGTDSPRRRKKG